MSPKPEWNPDDGPTVGGMMPPAKPKKKKSKRVRTPRTIRALILLLGKYNLDQRLADYWISVQGPGRGCSTIVAEWDEFDGTSEAWLPDD